MRLLGIGLNGIKKFCAFMDLPRPIYHSCYDAIVETISLATQAVRVKNVQRAAAEEKSRSVEKRQNDGITVSGDGSWRKRGFSSLFGIVSLIGWMTGKIVDIVVKSKYCKACEFWKSKEGSAEYEEWVQRHAEQCQSSYTGSAAGKMESTSLLKCSNAPKICTM